MACTGEHAHVPTGLGDEHLGGLAGEPGDARQQFAGGAKGGHRFLDALIEAADISGVGVDLVEEQPGHECVMRTEPAGQRLGQCRDLAA